MTARLASTEIVIPSVNEAVALPAVSAEVPLTRAQKSARTTAGKQFARDLAHTLINEARDRNPMAAMEPYEFPLADDEWWGKRALCATIEHPDIMTLSEPAEGERAEVPYIVESLSSGQRTKLAKTICNSCVVRQECLKEALERQEAHHIWGAMTFRERKQFERQARKVSRLMFR